jgi:hypothetical protein
VFELSRQGAGIRVPEDAVVARDKKFQFAAQNLPSCS